MSACPETKSHLSKNERDSLFLSLFIPVIDELWLNRRPTSRTSCGKKWMVLTQLGWERKQHSSRVLNMNQCIINIIQTERETQREKRKKRNISSSKSHFTIGRSHISIKAISIFRIVLILSVKKFHFDKSYLSVNDNR